LWFDKRPNVLHRQLGNRKQKTVFYGSEGVKLTICGSNALIFGVDVHVASWIASRAGTKVTLDMAHKELDVVSRDADELRLSILGKGEKDRWRKTGYRVDGGAGDADNNRASRVLFDRQTRPWIGFNSFFGDEVKI
jgi:hypothetical protein